MPAPLTRHLDVECTECGDGYTVEWEGDDVDGITTSGEGANVEQDAASHDGPELVDRAARGARGAANAAGWIPVIELIVIPRVA